MTASKYRKTFDFVVAANRLPVDRVTGPDGQTEWRTSPGGLVSAMEPVMRSRDGAWVGWSGSADDAPEPFSSDTMTLFAVPLNAYEVSTYYEGFSNDTLWPIYHDVIVPASFHREWWASYQKVNQRFAEKIAEIAEQRATVWVHDYQLQLVPALLREMRPDLRIGWFDHIPFPAVELFAQLPWRQHLLRGLLGADFLGFQRAADADNFIRACRRFVGARTHGDTITLLDDDGQVERVARASAVPISIDAAALTELAEKPSTIARAQEIRESLGNPKCLLLGVDRLDYTKGIQHRIKAFGELLADGELSSEEATLVQVATPSRERVDAYREMRATIEGMVGRVNGDLSQLGATAIHYLHQSYPREEMAALFRAADVMLVTPLRDGMNLVAKEYVTCRLEDDGALVLSEFTGAYHELNQAFVCNPHDIDGLKQTILQAVRSDKAEQKRRMQKLRAHVLAHDVHSWAQTYLSALASAPEKPEA